jgi:microsomal dipeptidase-like Zn-dependent dipeptidase
MKRKIAIGIGVLLLAGVVAFFAIGPGWIERDLNRIDGEPLIEVSQETRDLHQALQIVDLHSDTLLWKRDMLDRANRGHVDLPRLREGNVALQVFSSVTKSPRGQNYDSNTDETDNITPLVVGQLQPVRTWGSLLERSLWHAEKLDRAVEEERDGLFQIHGAQDIEGLLRWRKDHLEGVGAMLSVEGLHNLEGDPANLEKLHAAGFRMAGLTHFFDNELAGSMHGVEKGGLTDMGRAVVRRIEELGMVVDIAHCSPACVADILAMARRPVVSSHGGVQATCSINRNLTDEQIRGVAATGGIIGFGYWPGAVCDTSPRSVAKAMRHIRDLVGIEYVALGSDFDGSVTTRFDTSKLVQVTQALVDEGFSESEIRAAMGGNALRVLSAGIEPMGEEA